MPEVLPSLVRAVVAVLDDAELDPRSLTADLPEVRRALDGATERIPWDEYATMLNRATCGLRDIDMERLGERCVGYIAELRALAHLAVSSEVLLSLSLRAVPVVWPHVRVEAKWVGPGEVHYTMEIPAPYVACPFWLHASVGAMRALPRLMGLCDASVEHEAGERSLRMHIRAPEPGTPAARSKEPVDIADFAALVETLLAPHRVPPPRPSLGRVPAALELQRRWGLTRSEARVARRLATGMRLEQVARDLGVSRETVRTHLKSLFGKTATRRQVELVALIRGLPLDGSGSGGAG